MVRRKAGNRIADTLIPVFILTFFVLLPDISRGCNTADMTGIEQLDNFFLNSRPSESVEVWVTYEENDREKIEGAELGRVIKVHARFEESIPEGNYIFYLRPDTGAYENSMIFKGRHSGNNKINGTYASFYIPRIGQMEGEAKVYVLIPGHGVGSTRLQLFRGEGGR